MEMDSVISELKILIFQKWKINWPKLSQNSKKEKDETEKRSSLRNSRSAPILEPLKPRPLITPKHDPGNDLYFKNASGEQERIPTLAERYETDRFPFRQDMIRDNLEYIGMQRIPSETTVILTHRTGQTDQSGENTIKSGVSKVDEFLGRV